MALKRAVTYHHTRHDFCAINNERGVCDRQAHSVSADLNNFEILRSHHFNVCLVTQYSLMSLWFYTEYSRVVHFYISVLKYYTNLKYRPGLYLGFSKAIPFLYQP